jgi:tripartite-type tricarboxylate transporter receptor subunit TctC
MQDREYRGLRGIIQKLRVPDSKPINMSTKFRRRIASSHRNDCFFPSPQLELKTVNARLVLLCLMALPVVGWAQPYPAKPIRLYTQFGLGGGGDLASRVFAPALSQRIGQPVVVDARSGGGGIVAASLVARAEPDGYSVVLLSPTVPTAAVLPPRTPLPFDPSRDLSPVVQMWETATVLVANMSVPVSTMGELIEYARRNPGKLSYGTTGIASSHHLNGEQLNMLTGIQTLHVPYKNSPVADTAAGVLPLTHVILIQAMPFIRTGKVKPLAITTRQRVAALPDVPPLHEIVKGYEPTPSWTALFAPGRLPAPIARRLHDETAAVLANPEVRAKLQELGFDMTPSASPEDFAAHLKRDLGLIARIVKAAKIEAE